MSGRRITELAEASAVAPGDLFPIVDMSGTPTTKQATAQQLVDGVGPLPEPNVRTADYTLTLADKFGVVEMDVASANTVTVPPNSTVAYPVGTLIRVTQIGAGVTTIAAGSGVTVLSPFGLVLPAQNATVELRKRATAEWVLDVVTGGATSKNSIETDDGDLQLVGDADAPGNDKVYGTDGTGTKGWKDDPAGGAADDGNVLGGDAPSASAVAAHPGAVTTGNGAIALGDGATADSGETTASRGAVVIGYDAKANGNGRSVVLGALASITGIRGVIIGHNASGGGDGVIIGEGASNGGGANVCVVVGRLASGAASSVALGNNASCGGGTSTVVGLSAQTTAAFGTAVGAGASASNFGTAVGRGAAVTHGLVATNTGGVAVGTAAACGHARSVALGSGSSTTATDQVMVGPRDVEITGIVKGIVLVDRTAGTRHRVYLDGGVLEIEAA